MSDIPEIIRRQIDAVKATEGTVEQANSEFVELAVGGGLEKK